MRLLEASHAFEVSENGNLIVSGECGLTGPLGLGYQLLLAGPVLRPSGCPVSNRESVPVGRP